MARLTGNVLSLTTVQVAGFTVVALVALEASVAIVARVAVVAIAADLAVVALG